MENQDLVTIQLSEGSHDNIVVQTQSLTFKQFACVECFKFLKALVNVNTANRTKKLLNRHSEMMVGFNITKLKPHCPGPWLPQHMPATETAIEVEATW